MRIPLEAALARHPFAEEILHRLIQAGFEAVVVGGAVRDVLLAELRGQPCLVQDVDIATSAPPEVVHRLFADRRVLTVGESFGVVVVVAADGRQYEVATFRSEAGYSDGRRPDQVGWGSLEEDLGRRDFTVNGMAARPDGELVDPVGGVADLEAGLVRAIGQAELRFAEDHLRMLRAVRFACQLGFALERETAQAIRVQAAKITAISWERIRDELLRILATPRAAQGLALLRELDLLPHILPEVSKLQGVPQPEDYHPEGDVFTHTEAALAIADGIWDVPLLKLAVLFHDVGKPSALARSGGENMGGHCHIGAELTRAALTRLRLPRREGEHVVYLVREHMRVGRLPEMGLGKQVQLMAHAEQVGEPLDQPVARFPLFADLLRLAICDAEASAHRAGAWLPLLTRSVELLLHLRQIQGLRRARELVTGDDLVALGEHPGPRLGQVLAQLHERILAGQITTREQALSEAARLLARERT